MKKISLKFKTLPIVFLGIMLVTNCKDSQKNTIFWPMALSGESPVTTNAANPQSASPTTSNPAETVQPGSFTSFGLTSPQVTGSIDGTNITVMVPANTPSLSSFIATFVHNGASVSINGTSQVSGVTVNDFTSPITYTITDKDGKIRTYTVTVKRYYPIAGTGITKCYDNVGSEIACGNSDYPNQDGDSKKPQPSFTGPTQNATYPNDYTTTDNIIGNVWKTCTEGLSGADCGTGTENTYANFTSATNACSALNSLNSGAGYAGRTDWRLPNTEELISIMDLSKTDIRIQSDKFPNIPIGNNEGNFWSSTKSSTSSWNARYSAQASEISNMYPNGGYVRCISGVSTYSYIFQDNDDGTLTDNARGLIWQKCTVGQTGTNSCSGNATKLNWGEALQSCNSLNLAGKKWRLPSVRELMTLINYTNFNQPIDQATESVSAQEAFVTSTTGKFNLNNKFSISITLGAASNSNNTSPWLLFPNLMDLNAAHIMASSKSSNQLNVRCVSDLE